MNKAIYKCCGHGCTNTSEKGEGLFLGVYRGQRLLMTTFICNEHWLNLTQGATATAPVTGWTADEWNAKTSEEKESIMHAIKSKQQEVQRVKSTMVPVNQIEYFKLKNNDRADNPEQN